jgi:teichoic acid transport system ATP-binding protein
MCSDTADTPIISVFNLSKKYPIYGKKSDRLKEAFHPLRKKFHRDFWALKNVSFEVSRGETFGIIGVNGSGKSTLLGIICGVLRPSEGEYRVKGRVSALLELGSGFNPEFTGRENVYLQGAILGYSREEIEKRFDSIADFADIGDFLDQPVKTYSSGMMVRLAFSVAINVDPSVLIVDEVLAVGDVFFQAKCYAKLEELKNKNTTILLVSHDMNSIRTLCDKALCLDGGHVIDYGKSARVVETYFKNNALKSGCFELDSAWSIKEPEAGSASAVVDKSIDLQPETIDQVPNHVTANDNLQYGNGKAKLLKYIVNGATNCKEVQVESSGMLEVETAYFIRENIQNPIFGLMLKTPIGIEIYGNNTTYAKKVLSPLSPGQTVRARFTQKLHLNNGPYLLTMTIAEWVDHQVVYIDRRVDVVLLSVAGGPMPHIGFCNFEGAVEVEDAGAPVPLDVA